MLLLESKDIVLNISMKENVDKWILNVLRYQNYK